MKYITGFVSVIIPVYQKVKYIRKCVNSVLKQTYGNFEIILVDDGSTDGSELLCDEYAKKYNNVVVIHQKNAGASHARNVGISVAQGEYLLFLDADDYIENRLMEDAIKLMSSDNSDMLLYGFQQVIRNGICRDKENVTNVADGCYKYTEIQELLIELYNSSTLHCIGTKIYKKDIIDTVELQFNEKWHHWEDIYFTLTYLLECETISVANHAYYYYKIDVEESLWKQGFNKQWCYETMELLRKCLGEKFENSQIRNSYYTLFDDTIQMINDKNANKKVSQSNDSKYKELFLMMNRWMSNQIDGNSIGEFIEKKEYKTVAIYGMNYVGQNLLKELRKHSINVKYGIDRNANNMSSVIPVYSTENNLEQVDIIIVTAVTYFEEIKQKLQSKINCEIISLEDVINDISGVNS